MLLAPRASMAWYLSHDQGLLAIDFSALVAFDLQGRLPTAMQTAIEIHLYVCHNSGINISTRQSSKTANSDARLRFANSPRAFGCINAAP